MSKRERSARCSSTVSIYSCGSASLHDLCNCLVLYILWSLLVLLAAVLTSVIFVGFVASFCVLVTGFRNKGLIVNKTFEGNSTVSIKLEVKALILYLILYILCDSIARI